MTSGSAELRLRAPLTLWRARSNDTETECVLDPSPVEEALPSSYRGKLLFFVNGHLEESCEFDGIDELLRTADSLMDRQSQCTRWS